MGLLVALAAATAAAGPPPPIKDSDGDGLRDTRDTCPFQPGPAPSGCPELDSDSDGLLDSRDECPGRPGTPPTGCPDGDGDGLDDDFDSCPDVAGRPDDGCPDRDGDGLRDIQDRCPDAAGIASDGCPDPDLDGMSDRDDRCPGEPETRNGFDDADGCPDSIPPDLASITGIMHGIQFHLDKDTIKPVSRPILDRVVRILTRYPGVRIEIVGHTDSTGNPKYGKDISGARSASVRNYLIDRGIAADRLEYRGAGGSEQIATNKTAAGRRKNRRIEFLIVVE